MVQPTDPHAALAVRVAALEKDNAALTQRLSDLEEANAALEQRVADLEELHAAELQGLRAEDPEAQAARAAEQARDRERGSTLKMLMFAETPVNIAAGALRAVIEAGKAGKLVMQSDAEPLRRPLPRLEQVVGRVRELMAQEPWPEAEERLQTRNMGEALLGAARAVLKEFDELVAAREGARRPRTPVG